ncbi:MAG: galactokinase [Gemmatimonadetes bacterium]|nr:galactokinase [Gemmatimonadota bacterium]
MTEPSSKRALDRAQEAFEWAWGRPPQVVARAPGRANLIGEHVDYNDGFVLPVAIDRDVVVSASPVPGRHIRAYAADLRETSEFSLDAPGEERPPWTAYIRGVATMLENAGIDLPGADVAIAGDVPLGAGLSSSAALEVAIARAFLALARTVVPDIEIVEVCHRAERAFTGVHCGVMDQFAVVYGRAGHALFLDCRSLDCWPVTMPDGVAIVTTDSGQRRRLRDSAYNARVVECEQAARLLHVRKLRDVEPSDFDRHVASLPEPIARRARHVVTEIERTREAASALEAGVLWRVGRCMNESHESLRDDYEVSTPELDALVLAARSVHGVYGSRLSGAGFGGCTISLVANSAVAEFVARVPEAYKRQTGLEARVWICRAADGAALVRDPTVARGPDVF